MTRMPRPCGSLSAFALTLLLAAPISAQQVPLGVSLGDDRASRIERAIEALRVHEDTSGVVGLSAAFAMDGELAWAGGFGMADRENGVPADERMVSRIGSISKPVAAVMAMALVERGLIDLDAPISTYLPDYPSHNAHITTRQLMSHTAGVRHYRGNEFASDVRYDDVFAPMAVFWADSLLFEPGSAYGYSTYGWTVVSAVTDAADPARDWVRILRDEVVRPLGLERMQPEWRDSSIAHLARFYDRDDDGSVRPAPVVDNSNKWAGGGLVATTADLVRFALGLARGDVLADSTRAEMWSRQTPEGGPSYGLGWGVGELAGRRAVSHSGGSMGATAMLILLPDEGIAVAVLGNTGGVGHGGIAGRVARILLGEE